MHIDDQANQAGEADTSADISAPDTGAENAGAGSEGEDEGDQLEPQLDDDGNPIEGQAGDDGEEFEEIERDGKKVKVPAWLKPELMMHADYTKKTMELAEARRTFEAERQSTSQATQQEMDIRANLGLIDRQIDTYSKVDWNRFYDDNLVEAQKAFAQFQSLKDTRTRGATALEKLQQERTGREQQEAAARLEKGAEELIRDIPDFSPELVAKLETFAISNCGLSRAEVAEIDDPRAVKIIHAAYQWDQHQKKQKTAQGHAAAQTAQPAARPSRGAAPKQGLDDRLSTEEWVRRRNNKLRGNTG